MNAGRGESKAAAAAPLPYEEVPPKTLKPNEYPGQYAVKGAVYLEGEWHEDMIGCPGVQLQIAMPEDEEGEPGDWVDCNLQSTRTDLDQANEMRTFLYTVAVKMEGDTEQTYEVGAEVLRIKAPSKPDAAPAWAFVESGEQDPPSGVFQSVGVDKSRVEMYKGVALVDDDVAGPIGGGKSDESVDSTTNTEFKRRKVARNTRARIED